MKRHVTCFVEKARFEPMTLGTKAERYDHCATRQVKGAEENQVERNVLVGTVDAASHSTYGTQRTMEEFHLSICRKQFVARVMFYALTCLQYFLVSYGYIQVTSIYMKYPCNIHNIYHVYPIEIFCIYSSNLYDMHGTCMKMQCLYTQYTCYILGIYNVYPVEIFCIYSLNLFDMHGICMVYAMLIHTLYL